jgi:hypothetical protein
MQPYPAERDPADLPRMLAALPADAQKVRLVPA